jgi:3-oxoacyl-[acyl-carrier-protein] synthase-1/3-oxoacyl-[acyl-carrier-protein] synthase II
VSAAAIVAWGAVSALGEGKDALAVAPLGALSPRAVARDDELARAGLLRPFCARYPGALPADRDRATSLLERAIAACAQDLDERLPDWRTKRVGLALGTSSGGMRTFERAERVAPQDRFAGTYLGPALEAARPCAFEPFSLVLGACASSTLAIGVARAWLLEGACDVALSGGFDAVSTFVASGFEALRATCTEAGPRPFRVGRDGLALGEGAAVVALVRLEDVASSGAAYAFVTGFGATSDAVHLTAPDREGAGLARAIEQALGEVPASPIGLVSAHGTATDFNDAAEAKALVRVFGDRSARVPVHAAKGAIGHTLGAAGVLETLAAARAMRVALAPGSVGGGARIQGVRVLDASAPHEASTALKLSSAFGGANAALVVARDAPRASLGARPRPAYATRAVAIEGDDAIAQETDPAVLAARTGYAEDKIARADLLVRLSLAACAKLAEKEGPLRSAGIIVGHGLATIETNAAYLARIRAAGAHRGEPRRFPYTSPNAAAGECGVAFGLTGPSFAVGGGPHGGIEAVGVARDLVATGVADRIVVVAVDEAGAASRALGPDTRSGAVALLVSASPAAARVEEASVALPREVERAKVPAALDAHRALLPLVAGLPETLSADVPWGGFAKLRLFWL